MSVSAARPGVGAIQVGPTISTEFGVSGFQVAMGVFGGLAALVAAKQLQTVERDIHISELAVPVALGGAGVLLAAFLLPTGTGP